MGLDTILSDAWCWWFGLDYLTHYNPIFFDFNVDRGIVISLLFFLFSTLYFIVLDVEGIGSSPYIVSCLKLEFRLGLLSLSGFSSFSFLFPSLLLLDSGFSKSVFASDAYYFSTAPLVPSSTHAANTSLRSSKLIISLSHQLVISLSIFNSSKLRVRNSIAVLSIKSLRISIWLNFSLFSACVSLFLHRTLSISWSSSTYHLFIVCIDCIHVLLLRIFNLNVSIADSTELGESMRPTQIENRLLCFCWRWRMPLINKDYNHFYTAWVCQWHNWPYSLLVLI